MRFGFVTCVKLGLACMEEIYKIGGKLNLAITLKDDLAQKKSGRVYIDEFCGKNMIPLVKIKHINDEIAINAIKEHEIDWLFIIGWSQIAGPEVLKAPKKGCLGMHPTLLPEGRGRAAIPWAILKGLDKTGVTLFKLDENVDTGPIIAQEVVIIEPRETASTLYDKIMKAHASLISRVWNELVNNSIKLIPQDESKATYWPGRKPEDGIILPNMTTEEVDRLVRAVTHPYPGAFKKSGNVYYVIWAGIPHTGKMIYEEILKDNKGHLWFKTADGYFEATEWEEKINL